MPATNNTKRQHPFVSKACEACKIAHTKCDEEKPCSRCSRLSIECVPATKTRKDYRKNVTGRKVINHPSGSSSASHHHHPHTHNHSLFVHEFKVEQLQSACNDNVIDRHEQVMDQQDHKPMISSKNRKVSADTHRFHYYQPDSQRLQKRSKIDHHGGTNVASSMSSSSSSSSSSPPFFHQATTTKNIDTNGDDHDDNNSNSGSSSSSSNSGSSDVMMTSPPPTTTTTTITAGITTATNMRNMASQQLGFFQTAANNALHDEPKRISIGSDNGPLLLEDGLRLDLEDLNRSLSSSSWSSSSSSSSPSTFDFTLKKSQDITNSSDMMSMILSMNDPIMRFEAVHKILNENVALKKEMASMKMVNEALQTELRFYKSQQLSIQTIDDVSNVIRRCMTGFYNGIGVILTAQNGQIVGMNSYLRSKLGYEQLTFRQGLLQQQQQIGPSASWHVSSNDIILKSWRNLLRVDSAYASRMAYVGCVSSQNSIFRVHNPVFLRKFCIVNENAGLRPLTDLRYDIDGSVAQDQQFHLQTTNDLETAKYLESHMVYSNGKPLMVVTFVFFEEKSEASKS